MEVGDRVRIREDSEYYYQREGREQWGTIVPQTSPVSRWIRVRWEDGYSNDYQASDLQRFSPQLRAAETRRRNRQQQLRAATIATIRSDKKMKKSLKEAVIGIREAGFSHIKVELEANLNRSQRRACNTCPGSSVICTECTGRGAIVGEDIVATECSNCRGRGTVACQDCQGSGRIEPIYDSVSLCQSFIEEKLSPEAREAINYIRFYRDGSVDSELTFTLPIEKVHVVSEVIDVWKQLAKAANGTGKMDVRGAGMHIAVLPEGCNGVYPTSPARIDRDKFNNLESQLTKLMPALFFLGSANYQSRSLGYRHPRVSWSDKYSAVYANYGVGLEYRVFETCYDTPETFFDYVEVIANSLKFYADPTLTVESLGKEFVFTNPDESRDQPLARFYNTTEALRVLNAQIKYLKPREKSYPQLKKERCMAFTITSLAREERERTKQLRKDYIEYRRNRLQALARPLSESEQRQVDDYIIRGTTFDDAVRRIRGDQAIGVIESYQSFIKRNLRRTTNVVETLVV